MPHARQGLIRSKTLTNREKELDENASFALALASPVRLPAAQLPRPKESRARKELKTDVEKYSYAIGMDIALGEEQT
jgi:hypothetical protein